jgi:hypothetical protein
VLQLYQRVWSTCTSKTIKSRRLWWVWHVTHVGWACGNKKCI